jgi:hypothetical protein
MFIDRVITGLGSSSGAKQLTILKRLVALLWSSRSFCSPGYKQLAALRPGTDFGGV